MKKCCQTCKLRYEAHQTDFRKLGTSEPIDSMIDDAFICMAFAYEGIANLMIGTDPNIGFCEAYTPIKTMYYPQVDGITPSVIEPQFDKDINVRSKDEPNSSEKPNNSKEGE